MHEKWAKCWSSALHCNSVGEHTVVISLESFWNYIASHTEVGRKACEFLLIFVSEQRILCFKDPFPIKVYCAILHMFDMK